MALTIVINGKVEGPAAPDEKIVCDRCGRIFIAKHVYCICRG